MIEARETIKRDSKLKGCQIINNKLVGTDGKEIDIIAILSKIYEDKAFDLSVTAKSEETITLIDEDLELIESEDEDNEE